MKKIILSILILTSIINAKWDISYKTDKMTGKKSAFAISPDTSSVETMSFPYTNTYGNLVVGCNEKIESIYFVFNNQPNLLNSQTEQGYNIIDTRIKIDKKVDTVTLTQDWGSRFLYFLYKKHWIKKLLNSKSKNLLLELNWYGNGATYFNFDINGSKEAIKKIRDFCKKNH